MIHTYSTRNVSLTTNVFHDWSGIALTHHISIDLAKYPHTALSVTHFIFSLFLVKDPSRRCVASFVKALIQCWQQQGEDTSRNKSELEHQSEEDVDSYVAVETEPNDNPMDDDGNNDDRRSLDDRLFYIITFVFISLSFILAMIVDDLGIVLALVGSTGSTLVSYVLPGLIYIKVAQQKDAALVMAYVQLCLGLVLMPLALYFVLTKAAHH